MKKETILEGRWEFIGAEKHTGSKWQRAEYVDGMAWEFHPQYFNDNKVIGNIIETTPKNTPIEMAYLYNINEKVIKVEIYTDCTIGKEDESEVDFYEVILENNAPSETPTLKLNILSQKGYPLPYLRYILQKTKAV